MTTTSARFTLHYLLPGCGHLAYPNHVREACVVYSRRYFDHSEASSSSGLSCAAEGDRRLLCATLLFLAGKLTENQRRLRDVVNVTNVLFHHAGDPSPKDLRLDDSSYSLLKKQIVETERQVLIALRFEFEKSFICDYLLEACEDLGVQFDVLKVCLCLLCDLLAVRCDSCSSKQMQALVLLRASYSLLSIEWGEGESRFRSKHGIVDSEEEEEAEMRLLTNALTVLYAQKG